MNIFKRIIAFILVFASVFALTVCVSPHSHATSLGSGLKYLTTTYGDLLVSSGDSVMGIPDYLKWLFTDKYDGTCPATGGIHIWSKFEPHSLWTGMFEVVCKACGMSGHQYMADLEAAKFSTLDTTTAYTSMAISGYSCSSFADSTYYDFSVGSGFYFFLEAYPDTVFDLLFSLGVNDKVLITNVSLNYLGGVYFTSEGLFRFVVFENPFGRVDSSYLGVYSLSDLTFLAQSGPSLYYSASYAEASSNFYTTACYAFDRSRNVYVSDTVLRYPVISKGVNDGNWSDLNAWLDVSPYGIYGYKDRFYILDVKSVSFDNTRIIVVPTGADSTTRPASLMQTINNYNIDNSITDNSTNVNYYIGTVDASNNITKVYSSNLFDEDALVFTEPVSGVQYTCVGWKYYYDQRAYVLELADNAMSYEGTDIKYLVLMYGDDNVTVAGYSSETTPDNLDFVFSDSYAYVVASGSECSLYGHTNTLETLRDPTCTTDGQYKYTCTVCGNEEIVTTESAGHTFTYSVLRDASCSAEGLGLYSCSVCGAEYTESIPALAHTYEIREVVDAKYDEDGNLLSPAYTVYACTVCGDEYLDYTGDGVVTDDSGNWSWLKKWLTEFKIWLGEMLGLISGDTIINDYDTSVDITQDNGVDYNITYEDGSGQEQTTSIKEIVGKFAFIGDIYTIGETLISVVTADAVTAYALDNTTTSVSDYGIMSNGVPTLTVDLGAAESKYGYVYGGQVTVLDLSWYAPYKETVDNLLSGFLWLLFLWHLFKTAPSILGGVGLTTEHLQDISEGERGRKRGGNKK